MIIYVDIDGTICTRQMDLKYENAEPLNDRIKKINNLYDSGHTIVYWTARGTSTGKDWYEFTEKQLERWGVKYHRFMTKKPEYDIFIDDKNLNAKILDGLFNIEDSAFREEKGIILKTKPV